MVNEPGHDDGKIVKPDSAQPSVPESQGTDELRELLRRRTQDLIQRAVRLGEPLEDSEVRQVRNLTSLLEIRESLRSKTRPRRKWGFLAGFSVLLSIVSLLLFGRVPSTEIELDAAVYEVAFELADLQELTDGLSPVALGVTGLEEVRLPRTRDRVAETLDLSGAGVVRIRATGAERAGQVTLAPLALPAGSRCRLRIAEDPRHLRLTLESDEIDLQLHADGAVELHTAGREMVELEMSSPRRIVLVPAGRDVEFDFRFAEPLRRILLPQLKIAALDLTRIEERATHERTLLRPTSTLAGGSLYLESLDGRERVVRRGELLRFDVAGGYLRALEVIESPMRLDFHGRVREMTTGNQRSLMPSYLQYLHRQLGWMLLWGTVFGIFGFAQFFFFVWEKL